ncbi:MAG TPA: methyl-accepting chemotaxis protein [Longimicrobiales bacterium]|nr:methyl-accepting chemotaxis protein [Longimicrobiales bacterium]
MNWFERAREYLSRIRGRLVLAYALLVAGMFVLWLFGATALREYGTQVGQRMNELQSASSLGTQLVHTVLTQITAGEHYLVERDSASAARFDQLGFRAHDVRRRYLALENLSAEEQTDLARIDDLHSRLEVLYSVAHAQYDLGRRPEAVRTLAGVGPMLDELTTLIGDLSAEESEAIREAAENLENNAEERQAVMVLVLIFTVLLASLIVWRAIQAIDEPLTRLVAAAHRFGEGDLNARVDGRMPMEFSVLASAFGSMADRLRSMVTETVTTAEQISASASDLSSISEEVAASSGEVSSAMEGITSGAEDQAAGLRSVDESLHLIRSSSEQVAASSSRVRQLGDGIFELASTQRKDVRDAAQTLLEVRAVVDNSGREVFALREASDKITQFVATIQGIARQTDLLALNAAIEAARAGEHGRGFSVVAEEVRKLADGSARAADEVASTVRGIRAQIESVVGTMAEGTKKVAGVEEISKNVEGAFDSILRSIEEVRDTASRVLEAAGGNRAAVDSVEGTVKAVGATAESHAASAQEVSAAAEEQSAATEEMSAASVELLRAAERLRELVSGFKT